jgi:hypothetical protein
MYIYCNYQLLRDSLITLYNSIAFPRYSGYMNAPQFTLYVHCRFFNVRWIVRLELCV